LTFVTSNRHKFSEVSAILQEYEIPVEMASLELREIQADTLEEIAAEKAREACQRVNGPAMVEDTGLFIDGLNGFPGPYSAYVFRTVGNQGVLRLLDGAPDRRATFRSVFAYCRPGGSAECFPSGVGGTIALECRGGGWGYDPIFIAEGASGRTYGELGDEKNRLSHRRIALQKLARWIQTSGHPF
jgi:XTP/dITP diphosphohydrolase